jgi:hypothetical protein
MQAHWTENINSPWTEGRRGPIRNKWAHVVCTQSAYKLQSFYAQLDLHVSFIKPKSVPRSSQHLAFNPRR